VGGLAAAVAGTAIKANTTAVTASRAAASERNLIVAVPFLDDGPKTKSRTDYAK
jgi:hypothetical protein